MLVILMQYLVSMIPSLNDDRDFSANDFLKNQSLPDELDLRPSLQPIRNQGTQGSCAAQSAACMKEFQEKNDNDLDEHFSPQFVYDNRINQKSPGMTCRDVMKILYHVGCPLELSYPYSFFLDHLNMVQ